MTQLGIDWSADVSLPISGRTVQARHASATGAQQAVGSRGALSRAYAALLKELGPLSDVEASRALGRPLSSLTSTRNGLGARVVPSGQYEVVTWPGGGQTKRVRWQWEG